MNQEYKLRGYLVRPTSTQRIRHIALRARKILALSDGQFDMGNFLEQLSKFGITVDVIDGHEIKGFLHHTEACCIPESATIYLTNETYEKACNNDPRTLFTIFHELGHLLLMHRREFHREKTSVNTNPKPYMDSEWQADQFAAEILMPIDVIRGEMLNSPEKIASKFGVSAKAATARYNKLMTHKDI